MIPFCLWLHCLRLLIVARDGRPSPGSESRSAGVAGWRRVALGGSQLPEPRHPLFYWGSRKTPPADGESLQDPSCQERSSIAFVLCSRFHLLRESQAGPA